MRVILPVDAAKAETLLPEKQSDGSGVGINYADAMLKPVKLTLEDGRKVAVKRRGLKLTMTIGDKTGSALLRRLEHGPDVKAIFRAALREAAANAGATADIDDGGAWVLEY
ncbi:MAG: hypothetical protein U0132_23160 [Gemmatimonadaceae bacterium]